MRSFYFCLKTSVESKSLRLKDSLNKKMSFFNSFLDNRRANSSKVRDWIVVFLISNSPRRAVFIPCLVGVSFKHSVFNTLADFSVNFLRSSFPNLTCLN